MSTHPTHKICDIALTAVGLQPLTNYDLKMKILRYLLFDESNSSTESCYTCAIQSFIDALDCCKVKEYNIAKYNFQLSFDQACQAYNNVTALFHKFQMTVLKVLYTLYINDYFTLNDKQLNHIRFQCEAFYLRLIDEPVAIAAMKAEYNDNNSITSTIIGTLRRVGSFSPSKLKANDCIQRLTHLQNVRYLNHLKCFLEYFVQSSFQLEYPGNGSGGGVASPNKRQLFSSKKPYLINHFGTNEFQELVQTNHQQVADNNSKSDSKHTQQQNDAMYMIEKCHQNIVTHLLLYENGKILFSASSDNTIGVWDLESYSLIKRLRGHAGYIYHLSAWTKYRIMEFDNSVTDISNNNKYGSQKNHQMADDDHDSLQHTYNEHKASRRYNEGKQQFVAPAVSRNTSGKFGYNATVRIDDINDFNNEYVVSFETDSKESSPTNKYPFSYTSNYGEAKRTSEMNPGNVSGKYLDSKRTQTTATLSGKYNGISEYSTTITTDDYNSMRNNDNEFSDRNTTSYYASPNDDVTVRTSNNNNELKSSENKGSGQLDNAEDDDDDDEIDIEGKLFSGCDDGSIGVWNIDTLELLSMLRGHTSKVTYTCVDKDLLFSASADFTVGVWDILSLTLIQKLVHHSDRIYHLVSYNGRYLYSASGDSCIGVWEIDSLSLKKMLIGHASAVYRLSLSNNLKYDGITDDNSSNNRACDPISNGKLYSASYDYSIGIWDLGTNTIIKKLHGHSNSVYCLIEHNHRLYSGSSDSVISVWDLMSLKLVKKLQGCHANCVNNLLIYGNKLYSSSFDNTIGVWNLQSLELVTKCDSKVHTGSITTIVQHAGSIISASYDGTICEWIVV